MKDVLSPLVDPWIAQAPDAPADEVADKILAELDPEDLPPILRSILIDYWTTRRPLPVPASAAAKPAKPTKAAKVPAPEFGRPRPGPSYRERAAVAWRDRLAQKVTVNGTSKTLGECTLFEVRLLGSAARREADTMMQAAAVYTRLADAMAIVKAKRLADLPEGTLRPLLTLTTPGV